MEVVRSARRGDLGDPGCNKGPGTRVSTGEDWRRDLARALERGGSSGGRDAAAMGGATARSHTFLRVLVAGATWRREVHEACSAPSLPSPYARPPRRRPSPGASSHPPPWPSGSVRSSLPRRGKDGTQWRRQVENRPGSTCCRARKRWSAAQGEGGGEHTEVGLGERRRGARYFLSPW